MECRKDFLSWDNNRAGDRTTELSNSAIVQHGPCGCPAESDNQIRPDFPEFSVETVKLRKIFVPDIVPRFKRWKVVSDLRPFCAEVFDFVCRPRSEVEDVSNVALMASDSCVFELRIELPARGADKGHSFALLGFTPGFTDESEFHESGL